MRTLRDKLLVIDINDKHEGIGFDARVNTGLQKAEVICKGDSEGIKEGETLFYNAVMGRLVTIEGKEYKSITENDVRLIL